MKNSLSAQDILNDIEFELLQGAISRDDLGHGIQSVKKYQSKMRMEILQPGQKTPELREILGKQFQVNDMLITMLQEVVANQQAQELTLKRFNAYRKRNTDLAQDVNMVKDQTEQVYIDVSDIIPDRDTQDIQDALSETLTVKPDVQPSTIPIVGSFIQKVKHSFHIMVIYYLQKMAQKQTAVNQTYGHWLLHFDALSHHQQGEINQIYSQVAALKAQLDTDNNSSE